MPRWPKKSPAPPSAPATPTPGPWVLKDNGDVLGPQDYHVTALLFGRYDRQYSTPDFIIRDATDVDRANARLIAAAPEMLEALQLVQPACKSLMDEAGKGPATNWGLVNDCLVKVGKAIAKAVRS